MTAFTRLGMAAALFLVPALAFAGDSAPIGTWRNPDSTEIKIYNCGTGLCAQIVKALSPEDRDGNNPDTKKKNQKIQGLVIMSGAQQAGSNEWHGKLYNPKDGGTYDGKLILLSAQQLKLQGCALGGLVCKGETLSRAGD